MTKSQLIERIAERAPHVPRREVERIVNTVFESMVEALKDENRIEIRGFGSFAVKVREERDARNPKTGEKVHVPRRLTPYFTVGKELRDRLNHSSGDSETTDPQGGPVHAAHAPPSAPLAAAPLAAAPLAATSHPLSAPVAPSRAASPDDVLLRAAAFAR